MQKPRVLFCITVYNGRAFVPKAIESALRIRQDRAEVDVLVLDDASPEPGWSEELAGFCKERGVKYYCTPRNLGIPRNVNLGLLTAVKQNYDYVVISNSDVIYPATLITNMLRAAAHEKVGSVTAWSNNVSVYSLPNSDPNEFLASQDVVDWVDASVSGLFGDAVMDIPAGISFCILIPVPVVRDVGLMDPCFGRGYCEETDWSLRSLAAGYRVCLAPGTFVFHQGRGSNVDAGIVSPNATTVPGNEAIIDMRYPQFRDQVNAFIHSGILKKAHQDAVSHIIRGAATQFGYSIEVGWVPRQTKDELHVRALVSPDGARSATKAVFRGFSMDLDVPGKNVGKGLREMFGGDPIAVNLLDRGQIAEKMRDEFGNELVKNLRNYPTRI